MKGQEHGKGGWPAGTMNMSVLGGDGRGRREIQNGAHHQGVAVEGCWGPEEHQFLEVRLKAQMLAAAATEPDSQLAKRAGVLPPFLSTQELSEQLVFCKGKAYPTPTGGRTCALPCGGGKMFKSVVPACEDWQRTDEAPSWVLSVLGSLQGQVPPPALPASGPISQELWLSVGQAKPRRYPLLPCQACRAAPYTCS